MCFTTLVS